jgi:hypothetical protein
MRGQRLAKYSIANTTNSPSGTAWMPAAFVTVMAESTSPRRRTHSPMPELLDWIQRRRGARDSKSWVLGWSTSNITSAWANRPAQSAAWAGVSSTGG